MKINPKATEIKSQVKSWRHHIHANPELSLKEFNTSKFIIKKLKEMAIEYIVLAGTGVVATIKKGTSNRAIAFRCEIDALPILEANDFPHKSKIDGVMHACGHDGHSAMLLGGVLALKDSKDFDGTVHFIFQLGEEGSAGAKKMIDDGLLSKCQFEEIYALHNWPGVDVGSAVCIKGPVMAATDSFKLKITGEGGHAAMPNLSIDPVVAASQLISALQTLVSRNVDPLDKAVLSVTVLNAGNADNIIPDDVEISGTVRTFSSHTRDLMERRIGEVCKGFQIAFNVNIDVNYKRGYPPTYNWEDQSDYAAAAMGEVLGDQKVITNSNPCMGAEDFSYILEKVPGNYIWLGAGDRANLHNASFDFNDDIIEIGITYWMNLASSRLPVKS